MLGWIESESLFPGRTVTAGLTSRRAGRTIHVARQVFFGSAILCLLCVGLSQMPDPGIFGLHDEPERIAFYGGSGFLAGFSGFLALISGAYVGAARFVPLSPGQRRILVITIGILIGVVVIAAGLRLLAFR